jgi:uncharacterized membrane protein
MNPIDHLHPSVVHFPIALLCTGSATGLVYLFFRPRPELRLATWLALLAGWVACAAAVLTGLIAQSGLPPDAPYRAVLNRHIAAGFTVLAIYGLLLYQRLIYGTARARKARARMGADGVGAAGRDLLDDPTRRLWNALLLLIGLASVVLTGWNGGELVYLWGVNVGG